MRYIVFLFVRCRFRQELWISAIELDKLIEEKLQMLSFHPACAAFNGVMIVNSPYGGREVFLVGNLLVRGGGHE